MNIEVLTTSAQPEFDTDADLVVVADGFIFVEGPLWSQEDSALLFSDIPADTIYRHADKSTEVWRRPSGFSNGLTFDAKGSLLACEHRGRRVAIGHPVATTVVSTYEGKRLNSPNDIISLPDGSILFTDPRYGFDVGYGGPARGELDFAGVYRVPPGASEPDLIWESMPAPNGLAVSPDGNVLYVSDSELCHVRRFEMANDGRLLGGEIFASPEGNDPGVPDGIKVDRVGRLYTTGPGGVWVYSEEGMLEAHIRVPEVAANLTWGSADLTTLYITATTSVYSIVPGPRGHLSHVC